MGPQESSKPKTLIELRLVMRALCAMKLSMATPPINPNWITTLRLPIAPVTVAFLMSDTKWGLITAMVLALFLEITDILDGLIARKYNIVTQFGKLYDPFSDAFCRYTLFLGLYAIDSADLWMLLVIFYRDSAISFFRSVAASKNLVVGARKSGKIKAIVQGAGVQVAFLFLVLEKFYPEMSFEQVPWWTMLVITIVTAFSFVDYFFGYLPVLRKAWSEKPVKD